MEEDKKYTLKDKDKIKELIKRKKEDNDSELHKLETETKEAINELKHTIARAGRNIKIEVTDEYTPTLKFKNCLCCNQQTLTSEIHDICSNCEWQDDPTAWNDIDFVTHTNGISLRQARLNYEKTGNCDGIIDEPVENDDFKLRAAEGNFKDD